MGVLLPVGFALSTTHAKESHVEPTLEQRVERIERAAEAFRKTFEASGQSLDTEITPGSAGLVGLANSVRLFVKTIVDPISE